MELLPFAQSLCRNKNAARTSKNPIEIQKLNFSRSALFHMKT